MNESPRQNSIVLIVDDHGPTRRALGSLLRINGYDARSAPSGRAALRLLTILRPEAVILDLALPDIDGIEVLSWVRRSPALHALPVVVFTGDPDYLAAAQHSGAASCLEKGSVSWSALLNRIEQVILTRRAQIGTATPSCDRTLQPEWH